MCSLFVVLTVSLRHCDFSNSFLKTSSNSYRADFKCEVTLNMSINLNASPSNKQGVGVFKFDQFDMSPWKFFCCYRELTKLQKQLPKVIAQFQWSVGGKSSFLVQFVFMINSAFYVRFSGLNFKTYRDS